MKRKLSLLLVLALLVSMFAACSSAPASSEASGSESVSETESTDASGAESETESEEEIKPLTAGEIPMDTFIVGTPEMSGDFIHDFSNNSYDLAIKTLTSGYMDVYVSTDAGELVLNTVAVADSTTELDADGNKTYTITLHEDIMWNDGTAITATDYVASILLKGSKAWLDVGATQSVQGDKLVGYTEYREGETDVFSGVKLISDTQFSMTIAAENLPYFWEYNLVAIMPIHTPTYFPTATVMSDDTGSWLEYTEGDIATDAQRIADTERFAPTITCGPYNFVSYQNKTATLVINEYFKGDLNGNKPTITNVVQQNIPSDTDVEWVINGQVDLVAGVIEGEKIESAADSGTTNAHSYLRSGYGNLAFATDFGPVQDANVRWALASLIDRSAVLDHVLGGYGGTVDGAYGLSQWMYQDNKAELQASLKPISFNTDTANDYLDQTEWVFEADGTTAFDREKVTTDGSYLRHNAAGETLTINHFGTTENSVTDIIEIQYTANAPLAGVDFNVTKGDFDTLLDHYYYGFDKPEGERIYHSFNLATNFTPVDDKYQSWNSEYVGTSLNATQLSDPEIDTITAAMRAVEPGDNEAYIETWIDFQVRWNELMPEIPLYSNEYFDITHENVDPLTTTPLASWYEKICEITKTDKTP